MADERVERRLTAILAADIAGYSLLMGRDEEGTLAQLQALRKSLIDPKVEQHRGRIVKTKHAAKSRSVPYFTQSWRARRPLVRGFAAIAQVSSWALTGCADG